MFNKGDSSTSDMTYCPLKVTCSPFFPVITVFASTHVYVVIVVIACKCRSSDQHCISLLICMSWVIVLPVKRPVLLEM